MQDERDEQSIRFKDMMDMHQKEVHDLNVKHEKELAAAKRKYLDREGCNLAASPSSSIFSVELTPKKVKLLGDIASMAQKSFNSSSPVQKEASLESCSPVERTLEVDVSPQRATTSTTTSSTPSSSTPSSSRGLFAGVKLGDKPPLVELSKGSGITLTAMQLSFIHRVSRQKPELMLRKLLEAVFTHKELVNGCAMGARLAANKKSEGTSTPLDSEKLSAIKDYILKKFKQTDGKPALIEKDMNAIINSKCATVRRGLNSKKAN
ncbi:uncharacterized protein [Apostichopus japonicus]|uniref:uncharacterized protein n=1 Tax=Stichopus japonicus TaxID=307972 RepID=UPI003AB16E2F